MIFSVSITGVKPRSFREIKVHFAAVKLTRLSFLRFGGSREKFKGCFHRIPGCRLIVNEKWDSGNRVRISLSEFQFQISQISRDTRGWILDPRILPIIRRKNCKKKKKKKERFFRHTNLTRSAIEFVESFGLSVYIIHQFVYSSSCF